METSIYIRAIKIFELTLKIFNQTHSTEMIASVDHQETPYTSGTCGSSSISHPIQSDLSSTSSDSDYKQRKDLPSLLSL